ncbi:MAG: Tyrosine recombinase XerC [Planctomycetes bacterium]|nr:Tyrosine recombinase XerC [Planctomycetota bacterium]
MSTRTPARNVAESGGDRATPREARRFEAFREHLRRDGLAPVTRACYASDWATLAACAGPRGRKFDLKDFGPARFDRMRRRQLASGTAPATLNRRLSFLRRYAAFAARAEPWLERTARGFAELPFLDVARRDATAALDAAGERRLRAAADVLGPQCAAIVSLLLGTGLRAEDAARIRSGDVQIRAGRAEWVRVRGRRPKLLRLGPYASARMAALLAENPRRRGGFLFRVGGRAAMDARAVEDAVRRAADAAGVRCTAESLRRTFVVRYLAEHPDDDRGLAEALGVDGLDEVRAYRAFTVADPAGPRPLEWRHVTPEAASRDPESFAVASSCVRAVRDEIPAGAEVRVVAERGDVVMIVLAGPIRVHAGDRAWIAPSGGAVLVPRGSRCRISPDGRRAAAVLRVQSVAAGRA